MDLDKKLSKMLEEAKKYKTCMSLNVTEHAVELLLDTSVPIYSEWIKGEGADIALFKSQETGKVMGCRLPIYDNKLSVFHQGPIKINNGFLKEEEEDNKIYWMQEINKFIHQFGKDIHILQHFNKETPKGEIINKNLTINIKFNNQQIQPERRDWIRKQLKSGELKDKPIFYYKELGEPSHATALDYLINNNYHQKVNDYILFVEEFKKFISSNI